MRCLCRWLADYTLRIRTMQAEQRVTAYSISPTGERLAAVAGFAAITVSSGAVAYFDPSTTYFLPVCPLYALTGFACPGCGVTRGFHALFHGDILTALDFNALIPIWALIVGYIFVSLALVAARGKGLPMWPTRPWFLWAFMVVLLVFSVVRNIPIWPFTILFP